jgi:acyl-CoA thioesterase-1
MLFSANQTILFQGDSITDAGRNRDDADSMGWGYASYASAWLDASYPDLNLKFYNRGISGNRTVDLRNRWQADCIDLQPDWVSILIGINDTWRYIDHNELTPADVYEDHYRAILNQAKSQLDCRFILLEPFLLHVEPAHDDWHQDLDPKIQVVRKLAREFDALYVPFDGLFASVSASRPPAFWAHDGVHPTNAGHMLMAKAWLNAVGVK